MSVAQGFVDLLFDLDVDGARGVVENKDRWVHEQGSRDGDPLALATRERVTALADDRLVAAGSSRMNSSAPAAHGGGLDLRHRRAGRP